MRNFDFTGDLNCLIDDLKIFSQKAPTIIKNAVNRTTRQTRTELMNQAKKTYVLDAKILKKSITIHKATNTNPKAIIYSKGEANEISDFKTNPFVHLTGNNRPNVLTGKIKKKNAMTPLKKGNIKAFVTTFKSGHVAAVERVPGKRMKNNPKKVFLRKVLSPAAPMILGTEEGYNLVEPKINKQLQENVLREIDKLLRKAK